MTAPYTGFWLNVLYGEALDLLFRSWQNIVTKYSGVSLFLARSMLIGQSNGGAISTIPPDEVSTQSSFHLQPLTIAHLHTWDRGTMLY